MKVQKQQKYTPLFYRKIFKNLRIRQMILTLMIDDTCSYLPKLGV